MATFTISTQERINTPPYQIGSLVLTIDNGTEYVFTTTDFSSNTVPPYKDYEDDPPLKIKILNIYLENTGVLTLNDIPVNEEDEILMSDIELGLFKYKSNTLIQDVEYIDTFEFDIADEGSQEYGGLRGSIRIIVKEVENLPPSSVGDGSATISYNETLVFTRDMFTTQTIPPYSDPEGDAALLLKIIELPTNGNLIFDGSIVILDQIINFSDIDAGLLIFQPDPNIKISNIENFKFQIADQGSGIFVG